jgi:hypothetical protein
MGTTFCVSRFFTLRKAASKSACSLSIIEATKIRGIPRASQYSQTFSVPTSTPAAAFTTITAASAARMAATVSPLKSR